MPLLNTRAIGMTIQESSLGSLSRRITCAVGFVRQQAKWLVNTLVLRLSVNGEWILHRRRDFTCASVHYKSTGMASAQLLLRR